MDKSWIYIKNRLLKEYKDGVKKFIELARNHLDKDEKGLNPLENNPYPYVKDEDWKWMCTECFESETWKKKSVAGASNREKSGAYMGGSKSLIQHLSEHPNIQSSSDSTSSGKYLDVFKLTHWSEKRGWQSDRAEADYQRMMEVRNERLGQLPEGSQLDSDDEEDIYSQVLVNDRNEKYGFKRGTGPVIKKRHLSCSGGSTQRLLVENLRTEVAISKQRVTAMEDRIKLQDERMKKQDERMKEQNELIQQLLQLLQHLNPPSDHSGPFSQRQNGLPPPPPPSATMS